MTSGDRGHAGSDAAIGTRALVAALIAIGFFALVLPFAVVRGLHSKRLDTTDADLRAMAAVLVGSRDGWPVPAGVDVVIGPGRRPEADDPVWANGVTYPLGRLTPALQAIGPDPWGNAYVACVDASTHLVSSVFSAGPNGRLETPAARAGTQPVQTLGDDRAVSVH